MINSHQNRGLEVILIVLVHDGWKDFPCRIADHGYSVCMVYSSTCMKSCDEVEKEVETKGRISVEEAISQAKIRHCPNCKKAFLKESGCNKMTCACGTKSCEYIRPFYCFLVVVELHTVSMNKHIHPWLNDSFVHPITPHRLYLSSAYQRLHSLLSNGKNRSFQTSFTALYLDFCLRSKCWTYSLTFPFLAPLLQPNCKHQNCKKCPLYTNSEEVCCSLLALLCNQEK